mgnify:CR=1 FL=1
MPPACEFLLVSSCQLFLVLHISIFDSGLCSLNKSYIWLPTAFLHSARQFSQTCTVVIRQARRYSVFSLDLISCPVTQNDARRSPKLRQLSNFRLRSNIQCLNRLATNMQSNMPLIKHIRTVLDAATLHIIPASFLTCARMRTRGLNDQFPINGDSPTNILKVTWPNPTPTKIHCQKQAAHPAVSHKKYHTHNLSQIQREEFWNLHEAVRQ